MSLLEKRKKEGEELQVSTSSLGSNSSLGSSPTPRLCALPASELWSPRPERRGRRVTVSQSLPVSPNANATGAAFSSTASFCEARNVGDNYSTKGGLEKEGSHPTEESGQPARPSSPLSSSSSSCGSSSTSSSTAPRPPCAECGGPSHYECSACGAVPICSHECFQRLWPRHHAACRAQAESEIAERVLEIAAAHIIQAWFRGERVRRVVRLWADALEKSIDNNDNGKEGGGGDGHNDDDDDDDDDDDGGDRGCGNDLDRETGGDGLDRPSSGGVQRRATPVVLLPPNSPISDMSSAFATRWRRRLWAMIDDVERGRPSSLSPSLSAEINPQSRSPANDNTGSGTGNETLPQHVSPPCTNKKKKGSLSTTSSASIAGPTTSTSLPVERAAVFDIDAVRDACVPTATLGPLMLAVRDAVAAPGGHGDCVCDDDDNDNDEQQQHHHRHPFGTEASADASALFDRLLSLDPHDAVSAISRPLVASPGASHVCSLRGLVSFLTLANQSMSRQLVCALGEREDLLEAKDHLEAAVARMTSAVISAVEGAPPVAASIGGASRGKKGSGGGGGGGGGGRRRVRETMRRIKTFLGPSGAGAAAAQAAKRGRPVSKSHL